MVRWWLLLASVLALGACVPDIDVSAAARAWGHASHLYPAPLVLQEGKRPPPGPLTDALTARGYKQVDAVKEPGDFHVDHAILTVRPLPPHPGLGGVPDKPLRIEIKDGRIITIRVPTGGRLSQVALPGVPFAEMRGAAQELRIPFKYDELPKILINAVVAIEDRRFFEHGGVDYRGIARAIVANAQAGGHAQGASTITQQLARNYFLTPEKTISRKLKEVRYAWALERKLSKKQILEHYLNEVYLGQRGPMAISGMGQAAYAFFSKTPKELTLEEAALLAGIIQAPNALAPDRHPERALTRRNVVLDAMRAQRRITAEEHKQAREKPIELKPGTMVVERHAPYFVDAVSDAMAARFDDEKFHSQGYFLQTTLDPRIQHIAERALADGLHRLDKHTRARLEGAVVVVQPSTGRVLALVGGRNYGHSQFNRAVDAQRQPGSVAKPLVVLAALQARGTALGPTTILHDVATTLKVNGRKWSPVNHDHRFHGNVTLREVIEQSINVPTVKLAMEIGLPKVVSTLRQLKLSDAPPAVPSVALGAFETTPIRVAGAYTAIASGGALHTPYLVDRVFDRNGRLIHQHRETVARPVTSAQAYMIRDMMRGVLDRGTARSARKSYPHPASGKTGTTNDNRDAWFVGFDQELLTVVWVGADNNKPTGMSGSRAALPIWASIMKQVRADSEPPKETQPDAIAREQVCADSFEKAAEHCPDKVDEVFWRGREPRKICHVHAGTAESIKDAVGRAPRALERWVNDLFD